MKYLGLLILTLFITDANAGIVYKHKFAQDLNKKLDQYFPEDSQENYINNVLVYLAFLKEKHGLLKINEFNIILRDMYKNYLQLNDRSIAESNSVELIKEFKLTLNRKLSRSVRQIEAELGIQNKEFELTENELTIKEEANKFIEMYAPVSRPKYLEFEIKRLVSNQSKLKNIRRNKRFELIELIENYLKEIGPEYKFMDDTFEALGKGYGYFQKDSRHAYARMLSKYNLWNLSNIMYFIKYLRREVVAKNSEKQIHSILPALYRLSERLKLRDKQSIEFLNFFRIKMNMVPRGRHNFALLQIIYLYGIATPYEIELLMKYYMTDYVAPELINSVDSALLSKRLKLYEAVLHQLSLEYKSKNQILVSVIEDLKDLTSYRRQLHRGSQGIFSPRQREFLAKFENGAYLNRALIYANTSRVFVCKDIFAEGVHD